VKRFDVGEMNAVRLARVALRRQVAELDPSASARRAAGLVADPPPELAKAVAFDVVCWVRRVGPARARKIMRATGVGDRTVVGRLTPRQRRALVGELERIAA